MGRYLHFVIALALLASCNKAPHDKEAVRKGVVEHLSKNSGPNMSSMDVNVTNVTFEGKRANATVEFKVKASPAQGMSMNYSLEEENGAWKVKKTTDSHGNSGNQVAAPPANGDFPPGHPPVNTPSEPAIK